ncbi:fructoselysine and glucoselysine-specific PTS system IIA component [Mucilaginibacter frigoritolerans]|jgi:fructoselysine/glucoselysine PTS system EIIA component|uniref:Fructoselysine and glucoselysine-specific PTS system IIA component n=1 Tax=Mucilaginibacter frigoritolerans TaxID=652788 RepID=A0A562U0S2_9SPHI|nr:PTS fructose transporter subunit IIA [Mucilaginibacter frigoritolerans]TWI98660.1 fructoselysine and glucoselysine-specific PTS system IIA component [Mucilaginibacter frigoritolerans]
MEQYNGTRKFLIATHGTFSAGVKSSLELIIGETAQLFILQAYNNENTSIEYEIKIIMEQVGEQDELIVFSDIMGGSVTNQLVQHALRPNVHIVSGFNLPLLIEIILGDTNTPVDELIETAISNAKEQMVYVNKLLSTPSNNDFND